MMIASRKRRIAGVAATAAGLALVAIPAAPAFAAGGGYGGTTPPAPSAPGGYNAVAASQTVGPTGGTVSGTAGGETVSVVVPPGEFPAPVQITLAVPTDLGATNGAISGLSIQFTDPTTGQPELTLPLATPMHATIHSSALQSGDHVYMFNDTQQAYVLYSNATVTAGQADITLTQDPVFAVYPAAGSGTTGTGTTGTGTTGTGTTGTGTTTGGVIPNSTTVHTGMPFVGEAGIALGLLAVGGAGMAVTRRRRQLIPVRVDD